MARPRQPLAVIEANGRKHLSAAEKEERAAQEVVVPSPKRIKTPKWLPKALQSEFKSLAKQLISCGLFTDLDAGVLGRYLISQREYLQSAAQLQAAIAEGNYTKAYYWTKIEDKHFSQCRACANDLGLSISSRCKLIIPMIQVNPAAPQKIDDLFGD